jgi:hypothetical protein
LFLDEGLLQKQVNHIDVAGNAQLINCCGQLQFFYKMQFFCEILLEMVLSAGFGVLK